MLVHKTTPPNYISFQCLLKANYGKKNGFMNSSNLNHLVPPITNLNLKIPTSYKRSVQSHTLPHSSTLQQSSSYVHSHLTKCLVSKDLQKQNGYLIYGDLKILN